MKAFVAFLRRGCVAKGMVGCALLICLTAAVWAMKLSSTTVDSFPAVAGTRSKKEEDSVAAEFPSAFDDRESIYIHCKGSDATCKCTAGDCAGFQKVVNDIKTSVADYVADGTVAKFVSYFDFVDSKGLAPLLGSYYNATSKSMLASLELNANAPAKTQEAAVAAEQKVVDDLTAAGDFDVILTGRLAALAASTKTVGKAIGMADGTGSLLIVVLFGWRVRSWRLTIIPFFNTLVCYMLAEALVYVLSSNGLITLPSFVPNVCLFLCIALSVDYSFFHLSRFQELRKEGVELVEAVEQMVVTAGRVVLISGVVLLFTWLALGFFPVFGIDTLGYCASITIFCCISVNLLLNPAFILAWPDFFGRAAQDPWRCCRRCRRRRADARDAPLATAVDALPEDPTKNIYGRIATVVTTKPMMYLVPLFIYAIFMFPTVKLFTAHLSVGGVAGKTSATEDATNFILRDFPTTASGAPLTVMLTPPDGTPVKGDDYFIKGCSLARAMQQGTGLAPDLFKAVMIEPSSSSTQIACMPWADAKTYLAGDTSSIPNAMYQWAWSLSANKGNASTLMTALPPFDSFSDRAQKLLTDARAVVDQFSEANAGWTAVVYHPMAIEVDAFELTFGRYGYVVAATVLIVFLVIGIRYRAAMIPVKLMFTIALPILAVLGSGVYVFQEGYLNWTGIGSLQKQGGLVWINPVACSFMLIGFALDYDLFLFSRIYDTRKRGVFKEDREAIIHAVSATGPVISTAGVIMALAFSGMVVQHDNAFLCQMGFTMILGVLIDTFILRTMLAPAILCMAGPLNWWPQTMPGDKAATCNGSGSSALLDQPDNRGV
eukprot:TRINITY_DN92324_c0_g1_i1.p1 TRINITY_DN92324_c0_g1~~TRINITY_DN92324_c0_g1_i1.p1  ORF type:complete len:870 (+),score=188.64 TRINITY_DN92324_c0_g1_i1:121-2610(+)